MAGRLLNRRELRKQADGAQQAEAAPEAALAAAPPRKAAKATKVTKAARVKKAPAAVKVKKPRAKKAPVRMRARWGVFDGSMKQVAIFDYSERGAAEAKLADLLAKKKSVHFMQIVKEPMPEPAPLETPAAP